MSPRDLARRAAAAVPPRAGPGPGPPRAGVRLEPEAGARRHRRAAGLRAPRRVDRARQPPRRLGERRLRSGLGDGRAARRGEGDRRDSRRRASGRGGPWSTPPGTARSRASSARPSGPRPIVAELRDKAVAYLNTDSVASRLHGGRRLALARAAGQRGRPRRSIDPERAVSVLERMRAAGIANGDDKDARSGCARRATCASAPSARARTSRRSCSTSVSRRSTSTSAARSSTASTTRSTTRSPTTSASATPASPTSPRPPR